MLRKIIIVGTKESSEALFDALKRHASEYKLKHKSTVSESIGFKQISINMDNVDYDFSLHNADLKMNAAELCITADQDTSTIEKLRNFAARSIPFIHSSNELNVADLLNEVKSRFQYKTEESITIRPQPIEIERPVDQRIAKAAKTRLTVFGARVQMATAAKPTVPTPGSGIGNSDL